jgi:transposase InsO family protein
MSRILKRNSSDNASGSKKKPKLRQPSAVDDPILGPDEEVLEDNQSDQGSAAGGSDNGDLDNNDDDDAEELQYEAAHDDQGSNDDDPAPESSLQQQLEDAQMEIAFLRSAMDSQTSQAANSAAVKVFTHSVQDLVHLTELTNDQVEKFSMQFKADDNSLDWKQMISPTAMEMASTKFAALEVPIAESVWKAYSNREFADALKKMCPADGSSSTIPFVQRMLAVPLVPLNVRDLNANDKVLTKYVAIEQDTPAEIVTLNEKTLINKLIKEKLGRGNSVDKFVAGELGLHNPTDMPSTMQKFRVGIVRETAKVHKAIQQVGQFAKVLVPGEEKAFAEKYASSNGGSGNGGGGPRGKNSKPTNKFSASAGAGGGTGSSERLTGQQTNNTNRPNNAVTPKPDCTLCGRTGHPASGCAFRKPDGSGSWHPNANTSSSMPWAQSVFGRQFAAKNISTLPFTKDINGNRVQVPDYVQTKANNKSNKPGELLYAHLCALKTTTTNNDYITCEITLSGQATPVDKVQVLLDNGALGINNYVSLDMAAKLINAGAIRSQVGNNKTIQSAFNAVHGMSKGTVDFDLILSPESSDLPIRLAINAHIIDSPIDVILGRNCIKTNNLVTKFPSQFYALPISVMETEKIRADDDLQTLWQPRDNTSLLTTMQMRNLHRDETQHENTDYDSNAFEAFEWAIEPITPSGNVLDLITIESDEDLLESDVRALLTEYTDIFSETLSDIPADLPPLELDVDRSMWEQSKHSLPPRAQTPANQVEIQRQLNLLKQQNIIRSSNAPHYSQVHLAEKPPKGSGKKRFCIDYVLLNLCTKTQEKWPLPNIQQLLQRLGSKRPKYFAVLDLTAGYHQAPVSKASIAFTAFICFAGIYEFLRVPFGLKGAPSYFQKVLANVVLAGLLYIICELYIDDIIVTAQTASEFLGNLRAVFDRLRKHRLVLSPRKVRIGLKSVEYTGHLINRDGITFTSTKIKSVLDFPPPTKKRQIKQFLGLANYFRDHIRNHSTIVAPLQTYVNNYSTRQANVPIVLSDTALAAFNTIKAMIEDCPTLFFLDDKSPVYLFTDACTYGAGGYLVQMVPNTTTGTAQERPIAFFSLSFTPTQIKWDIPQKEAYSIYRGIKKFEYLLRDRRFIIKTDHQNITFLNTSPLSMIRKWKIYISEFDSEFDYHKGEDNVVADLISRLVLDQTPTDDMHNDPVLFLLALPEPVHIPQTQYKLISSVHNSLAGHHGVERTLLKLNTLCKQKDIEPWPYMRNQVKQFIRQCPLCQKMSILKTPIVAHPFTVSSYLPMDRLNVDYVGPFPDGRYILSILDCFSRWVELYLCEQATAEEAAKALLSQIGRFGAPRQLLSDRGSHFVNELITHLLLLVGTEHCLTVAYSKEESSLIERENKEINRHLRALFFDPAIVDDYSLCIPLVQRILNSSTAGRTGLPPSKLLFGNMVDLDRGIFIPQESVHPDTQVSLSDHMARMLTLQTKLIELAESSIRAADNTHIASYSAARTEFPIDSYVLLDYPVAPPSRLHTKKRGPYKVVRFSNNDYVLLDLVSNTELTVNITRLSPFNYDPLHTDPRLVANRDQGVYDINEVLAHRGNINLKRTLEFYVSWAGYDDSHNSWEPWSNIRKTKQLHAYLRDKGFENQIPTQFR